MSVMPVPTSQSTSVGTPDAPPPSWSVLLESAVRDPGMIHAAYSAFHSYSVGNQLLALSQCLGRKIEPGPIATFNRWRELGRHVRKGERAISLCQPRTWVRKHNDEDDEEIIVAFTYRRGWFVLAQTEGDDYQPEQAPGWDRARALASLGLTEVPFHHLDGNVLGYASGRQIAVSPLSPFPHKTTFHEVAHCLLHTDQESTDRGELPRNLKEVEAEAVALLCCSALGLDGAEYARGYIQSWLIGQTLPDRSAQRLLATADKILRAGATPA